MKTKSPLKCFYLSFVSFLAKLWSDQGHGQLQYRRVSLGSALLDLQLSAFSDLLQVQMCLKETVKDSYSYRKSLTFQN